MHRRNFAEAEESFKQALGEEPAEVNWARGAALALCLNQQKVGRAAGVEALLARFPEDGPLVCLHGAALAVEGDARAAAREFEHARRLGTGPAELLSPKMVEAVEREAAPGLPERFGWTMLGFAGFYAAVMALMAGFGVVLARRTRGTRALDLLAGDGQELVAGGQ